MNTTSMKMGRWNAAGHRLIDSVGAAGALGLVLGELARQHEDAVERTEIALYDRFLTNLEDLVKL
jgi:hypothetical protein